jgi:hypothetical protein
LYVSDLNHRIRRIAPNGTVSMLAKSAAGFADGDATVARFNITRGMTINWNVLYLCDSNNKRIRGLFLNGTTFTLASRSMAATTDGIGLNATFNVPLYVTSGKNGIFFVTEQHAFRTVYQNRTVVTWTGSNVAGYIDGRGRTARFYSQKRIKFLLKSYLILANYQNHLIRRITLSGTVSTFAGTPYLDGIFSQARFFRYPFRYHSRTNRVRVRKKNPTSYHES